MCSRREADLKLCLRLSKGVCRSMESKRAVLGQRVTEMDEVVVDSQRIKPKTNRVYMAFHKPVGVTTTTDPKDPTNIVQFIDYHERLFPIGRLDKDSEGLIFLTNDGNIVNKILRSGNAHEKEYIVKVHKSIQPDFIEKMSTGVPILGTRTLPCPVQHLGKSSFRITLIQGMNRQIRRMCEVLGYKVTELKRVRIMDIHLGDLKVGRWRILTAGEVKALQATTADSASEHKPAKRRPVIPTRSGGAEPRRGTDKQRRGKTGTNSPVTPTRSGGTERGRGTAEQRRVKTEPRRGKTEPRRGKSRS
jgi:23S rRNA pseudouridine2604 synthase